MAKRARKNNRRQRIDRFKTSLFIAPSFFGAAVFFILPFFVVAYYSVIDNPINREFVGLQNFENLIGNPIFRMAAKNTAVFSLVAVPLAVIIPLVFAVLLMRKIPMGSWFKTVLISPLMVPTASVVLIWEVVFHYEGTVNNFLVAFGIDRIDFFKSDWSLLDTFYGGTCKHSEGHYRGVYA